MGALDRSAERLQRRHGEHAARPRPCRGPRRERHDCGGEQEGGLDDRVPRRRPASAARLRGRRLPPRAPCRRRVPRTRRSLRRRDPGERPPRAATSPTPRSSRRSAIWRVRPATIVENVLAVTIAATYTATPRRISVRKLCTNRERPAVADVGIRLQHGGDVPRRRDEHDAEGGRDRRDEDRSRPCRARAARRAAR